MNKVLSSPSEALEAGDEAVRNGNLVEARNAYRSVLVADTDSLDASVGLEYLDYLESNRQSRYHFDPRPVSEMRRAQRRKNLALVNREFEAKKTRLESSPLSLMLEHTTRCNFYCPHCSKGYDPYYAMDMSREVLDRTLDELLPAAEWACITGFGEPTLGSQYVHLMRRLVENEVIPHYSTNVSTLTIPHIEQLIHAGAEIILSIDGACRETFETIRAGGDWDQLIRTLHAIRRLEAIHGGRGWFAITFVAMRTNIHELRDMVRMVHQFDLHRLQVHDYHAFGEAYDENSLRNDPKTANQAFAEAEKLASELGVELRLPPRYVEEVPPGSNSKLKRWLGAQRLFPKRRRFPQRCKLPWQFTQITAQGEVNPCCVSDRVLGNLKEAPFKKIWNGLTYRLFRWRIETAFPPIECRECHVYEGISKGNPGTTMAHEGLLLRIAYPFERRLGKWLEKWKSRKGPPEPAPTYFKGKNFKASSAGTQTRPS